MENKQSPKFSEKIDKMLFRYGSFLLCESLLIALNNIITKRYDENLAKNIECYVIPYTAFLLTGILESYIDSKPLKI